MMAGKRSLYHYYIYFGGIILLAAALPLSRFLVTLSQLILLANWLAEGNLKNKLDIILKRKTVLFFLLIFLVHLLWLIPTQDFGYALKDLRIKLPLLILPLVLGTSTSLRKNEFNIILLVFTGSVIISSLFSIYRLSVMPYNSLADIREISVFISHIRFALLVNMAIFSLLYLLIRGLFQWNRFIRNTLWVSLAWLILFLFILQSLTGIIVFVITGTLFLFRFSGRLEKRYWYVRYPLMYGLAAIALVISAYSLYVLMSFSSEPLNEELLRSHSPLGNPYEHHTWNRQMENGNYVWINIAETELEQEWNRRSSIDYRERDMKGHELRYTLIRYLTSLGLNKDMTGMARLTETDILNIERGMANHIYQHNKWLYPRIYQIIWEIDNYRKGGNPTGHSVAQRFEYWKIGAEIVRDNFWFGAGTGDVALAWENQYAVSDTLLEPEWQLRAHNQFLTFLISFGITGLLIVLFGMVSPFFIEGRHLQILPFVFATIAILSMITEDTLETQAGATFFAFFYALFVFARKRYFAHEGEDPD